MIKTALGTTDIIICATSSTLPLFPSSWVRDGTHVILIGSYKPEMREVDRDLILRSLRGTLLVDSREACLREAGEILDACVQPEQMKEIGELIPKGIDEDFNLQVYFRNLITAAPDILQREFNGPVTVFKSVGIAVQDVVIASSVVERAYSLGERIGTTVSEYDPWTVQCGPYQSSFWDWQHSNSWNFLDFMPTQKNGICNWLNQATAVQLVFKFEPASLLHGRARQCTFFMTNLITTKHV